MKLTTLYPSYFPSLLWWQKALAADVIVIMDDHKNPRLAGLNRALIKSVKGQVALTVPVLHSKKDQRLIKDLEIDQSKHWRQKHRASLISNYRNAPYFEYYFPYLEEFLSMPWQKLLALNLDSIQIINKLLRWKMDFQFTSNVPTSGSREARVMQLLNIFNCGTYVIEKGSEDYFNSDILSANDFAIEIVRPVKTSYEQQFGSFIPGLSILDALFNEGPHLVQILK